jgi:hypothetical protein
VSSLLLTTGAIIAEIPEARPASASGAGGMGDEM